MLEPLLLAGPLLFGTAAWLYFEQDVFLTQAATYINQRLVPQVRRRLNDPEGMLGWEEFRGELLFTNSSNRIFLRIMTTFRLGATLGPGFAAVVAYPFVSYHSALDAQWWTYVVYVLDVLVVLLLAYQASRVIGLYRSIAS